MADRAQLAAAIMTALQAEPKPITHDRALAIARQTLGAKEPALLAEFGKWFEKYGAHLLERLNG